MQWQKFLKASRVLSLVLLSMTERLKANSRAAGPGDASPLHWSTSSCSRQWTGIGLTEGLLGSGWHSFLLWLRDGSNMFKWQSWVPICFCILSVVGWHAFDQGLSEARNVASEVLQPAFWWGDGSKLTMHIPSTSMLSAYPGLAMLNVRLNIACPMSQCSTSHEVLLRLNTFKHVLSALW